MEIIYKFTEEICDILNIDPPALHFDGSVFLTSSQSAALTESGLYLPDRPTKSPDLFFAIAHELRHAWQLQTDKKKYFGNYKRPGSVDTVTYNLQPAEIDANAFAAIAMIDFFGLSPQWENMPETVIQAINKRIKEIVEAGRC
jgi:hypothetical protein